MKYLVLCLMWFTVPSWADERPNVLFIGADDLRMNIGAYGDTLSVTPNIDALAKEGVVFNKAYVQFASCNASRASMMTGMRPDRIEVYKLTTHFRDTVPDAITLPQHFRLNGYHTQAIGKVYHNYGKIKDDESWSVPARFDKENHFTDYVNADSINEGTKLGIAAEVGKGGEYVDDRITTDAIETIKRLSMAEKPFFLGVGFMKPHSPYNAPKKFWSLYKREDMKVFGPTDKPAGVDNRNWFHFKELRNLTDIPPNAQIIGDLAAKLRHGYYAATSYMDHNLGLIIKALKDNGLYDNTIVVFWSDHGYHLGENGHWTKVTPRELDTRTPLIVRMPGGKAFTTNVITEYIDIYPTLSDLADLPAPKGLDGRSFKAVLEKPNAMHKEAALSQVSRPWPGNKPIKQMGYSIRTNEYRYTRWVRVADGKTLSEELYHTQGDPLERHNLLNSGNHAMLARMRHLFDTKGYE